MSSRFARLRAPLISLLCLACGAASAQSIALSKAQTDALGIGFAPVQPATSIAVPATGRVVPAQDAQAVVAAPFAGVVAQLRVSLGSPVKAGQALLRFDSPDFHAARAARAQAGSQNRLAAEALRRDEALFAEGIIAKSRLEATRARAAEARAEADAQTRALASSGLRADGPGEIVAPTGGVVVELAALPGKRFAAGDMLARIAQPAQLEIEGTLPPTAPTVHAGDAVHIGAQQARGTVLAVAPAVDGSAVQHLRVKLDEAGSLRVGTTVPISVLARAGEASASVFRVPARAVFQWRGASAVFAADAQGVTLVPVVRHAGDDEAAFVEGALEPSARVVSSGVAALKGVLMEAE